MNDHIITRVLCVNTDMSVAAMLVACTLPLVARVVVLFLIIYRAMIMMIMMMIRMIILIIYHDDHDHDGDDDDDDLTSCLSNSCIGASTTRLLGSSTP